MKTIAVASIAVVCLSSGVALAQQAPAPEPMPPPRALPAIPEVQANLPVVGKMSLQLYGFLELDTIVDSTQSFGDIAGNAPVQPKASYRGAHPRFQMSARDTRFGLRIKSDPQRSVTVTGVLEMDFVGNQPSDASEAQFFSNPAVRMRQALIKVESPYIDLWVGQTWNLFGWQTAFFPASVQVQGLPGQVFGRSPQIRLAHTFKSAPVDVELAAAAVRSPQRDSGVPDGQIGLRTTANKWKGLRTVNSTGTAIDGLSLGVSGLIRRFAVPELSATPVVQHTAAGYGLSIDALVPVIPATPERRGNSLTLTGSFISGRGISDVFTGLTGGVVFPALPPAPAGAPPVPPYAPGIDNGMVSYDAKGNLHTVSWQSFLAGVQYYLPPSGKVFLAFNCSQVSSSDIAVVAPKGMKRSRFADANLFVDPLPGLRFGLEYAWYEQQLVDDTTSVNHRGVLSGFYIF